MSDDSGAYKDRLKRGMFSPLQGFEDRQNTNTLLIVEKDGSVSERVSLRVTDPAIREELICLHYLRNYVRCFAKEEIGVEYLSRDAPWDFELRLSNGEQFFVEITAIADAAEHFEMMSQEERLRAAYEKPEMRVRDIRKLAGMFCLPLLDNAVKQTLNASPNMLISNPLFRGSDSIIVGRVARAEIPLADQLIAAIEKKSKKNHFDKDRTALILDYRGNFPDRDEIYQAMEEIAEFTRQMAFPEIWFYVGYFSDDEGNNAEFSFVPMKLPQSKQDLVEQLSVELGLDEHGRVIWRSQSQAK